MDQVVLSELCSHRHEAKGERQRVRVRVGGVGGVVLVGIVELHVWSQQAGDQGATRHFAG